MPDAARHPDCAGRLCELKLVITNYKITWDRKDCQEERAAGWRWGGSGMQRENVWIFYTIRRKENVWKHRESVLSIAKNGTGQLVFIHLCSVFLKNVPKPKGFTGEIRSFVQDAKYSSVNIDIFIQI